MLAAGALCAGLCCSPGDVQSRAWGVGRGAVGGAAGTPAVNPWEAPGRGVHAAPLGPGPPWPDD